MQYIIYIIFVIVSVVGLADILHYVSLKLLTKRGRNNKILYCYLKSEYPDLELRYVAEQYSWHGKSYADKIVAITFTDDAAFLEKCMHIAKKYDITLINSLDNEKILLTET